jgi:hypothetical protein
MIHHMLAIQSHPQLQLKSNAAFVYPLQLSNLHSPFPLQALNALFHLRHFHIQHPPNLPKP